MFAFTLEVLKLKLIYKLLRLIRRLYLYKVKLFLLHCVNPATLLYMLVRAAHPHFSEESGHYAVIPAC